MKKKEVWIYNVPADAPLLETELALWIVWLCLFQEVTEVPGKAACGGNKLHTSHHAWHLIVHASRRVSLNHCFSIVSNVEVITRVHTHPNM